MANKRRYVVSKKRQKERYDIYKKRYKEKKKMLQKKGYDMQESMYSFTEYKYMYTATKNDMPTEKNINRILVDGQAYTRSSKQAKSYQTALSKMGYKVNILDIRMDNIPIINGKDFEDIVSSSYHNYYNDLYKERKSKGMSTIDVASMAGQYIAQTFFGSN